MMSHATHAEHAVSSIGSSATPTAAPPASAPIFIINWNPEDVGLLRALAQQGDDVALTCVGRHDPEYIKRATASETACPAFDYRRGEVDNLSIDRFTSFLRDELSIHRARAVLVLPHRGRSEPDAFSRLACAAIKRACGDEPVPNIVVSVDDPEAAQLVWDVVVEDRNGDEEEATSSSTWSIMS